jgi:hypothetical protein
MGRWKWSCALQNGISTFSLYACSALSLSLSLSLSCARAPALLLGRALRAAADDGAAEGLLRRHHCLPRRSSWLSRSCRAAGLVARRRLPCGWCGRTPGASACGVRRPRLQPSALVRMRRHDQLLASGTCKVECVWLCVLTLRVFEHVNTNSISTTMARLALRRQRQFNSLRCAQGPSGVIITLRVYSRDISHGHFGGGGGDGAHMDHDVGDGDGAGGSLEPLAAGLGALTCAVLEIFRHRQSRQSRRSPSL